VQTVLLARRSRVGSTDTCLSLSGYPLALAESSFFSLFAVAGAHTAAAASKENTQRNSPLDPHRHRANAQEVTAMGETEAPMDPAMR
jgi:hypothetical protein